MLPRHAPHHDRTNRRALTTCRRRIGRGSICAPPCPLTAWACSNPNNGSTKPCKRKSPPNCATVCGSGAWKCARSHRLALSRAAGSRRGGNPAFPSEGRDDALSSLCQLTDRPSPPAIDTDLDLGHQRRNNELFRDLLII